MNMHIFVIGINSYHLNEKTVASDYYFAGGRTHDPSVSGCGPLTRCALF